MSQENLETVRRGYEAFAKGGTPAFEFLDPEIEWHGPREIPDLSEPSFGQGVGRYWAKLNEILDGYRMVPEKFIDAGGDRVLVFSRKGGRGKAAGRRSRRI